MNWSAPKIWPDATAYIIGGGPSVNSTNLELIKGKHVIGVNNAYLLGDWVDVCWFGDCRWFDWHKKNLKRFAGLKVTCCERCIREPGINVLKRSTKRWGIEKNPNAVSWNLSSGGSAINLAVHFGAKRIVLIGFDMKRVRVEVAPGKFADKANWHDDHPAPDKNPYERFLRPFKIIRKDLEELGIECINATPGSALTLFPVMALEETFKDGANETLAMAGQNRQET